MCVFFFSFFFFVLSSFYVPVVLRYASIFSVELVVWCCLVFLAKLMAVVCAVSDLIVSKRRRNGMDVLFEKGYRSKAVERGMEANGL